MRQAMRANEKKLFDELSHKLERLSGVGGEREKLQRDLEQLKTSFEQEIGGNAGMDRAVEGLNALRLRLKAVELDEEQCRARTDAARTSMSALRSSGVRELDRFEEKLEEISALPAEKRLFELQRLNEELREMEKSSFAGSAAADMSAAEERRFISANKKMSAAESRARVLMEIRDWGDRIAMLDETEGEKLRNALDKLDADTKFPGRLENLREQLKTKWSTLRERAASTAYFRERLLELLDILREPKSAGSHEAAELERRCNALYGNKFIDRTIFMALYEDVVCFVEEHAEEIADHFFVKKVELTLAEMGYELLTDETGVEESLASGQVRYLETPYDGYRVMLKADKGTLSTRLVRVAETENEAVAPDQIQKDIEIGKKWCRDFDAFLAKMRDQDLPLDVTLRKEPEEVELMAVVDKNASARKKKRRKVTEAEKLQERAVRMWTF